MKKIWKVYNDTTRVLYQAEFDSFEAAEKAAKHAVKGNPRTVCYILEVMACVKIAAPVPPPIETFHIS